MVLLLRKRHLLTVVAAAALCGALLLTARPGAAAVSGSASPQRAVILDAGHGGADGGAVSDSGVAESGLNLAITLRLADVLTFCGYEVLLTRTGEEALCDDPATTLRQRRYPTRKSVLRSSTAALTLGSSVSTRTACRVIPVSAVHRSSITDRTVQKRWRCAFRTI